MDIIEILQQPFMLRALYGAVIVAVLCALLGVFTTLKKQSFLADAVAHASLAGVAIGLLASSAPLVFALIVGVVMAIGITYLQKHTKISSDSVIGIFYSVLFAFGILILSLSPTYQPELSSYLFGSLLTIGSLEIVLATVVFVIAVGVIIFFYPQLVYMTFDREAAYVRGVKVDQLEYVLNILISIAIIVSLKLVGIVLVTALLIIPATSAKLWARSFKQMFPLSIAFSLISIVLGIVFAYILDAPPGAVIVIASGGLFGVLWGLRQLRVKS